MSTARDQANVLADLLRRERLALADFLVALTAFDRARRWVELGHASLFAFLVKDLGLSKGAAAYRRAAVELVQRFPQALDPIRDGRLCITTVFELSKVITDENVAAVLPRFFGTSKRDAKNVVAELAPEPPPTRTVVTPVHAPSIPLALPAPSAGRLADQVRAIPDREPREGSVLELAVSAPARTVVEPKTAELSRLHVTVSRRLLDKLARARDALSHSHPGASEETILEVGLDLILQRHAKRRGIGAKPRAKPAKKEPTAAPAPPPPPPAGRSRHVPAEVWRGVWERDHGRCAWPLDVGGVCGSTHQLELDHAEGWALGADTTIDECRVLCRFHQDLSARQLYGDDVMNRYTRPKGGTCSEPIAVWGAPRPRTPAHVDVCARAARPRASG